MDQFQGPTTSNCNVHFMMNVHLLLIESYIFLIYFYISTYIFLFYRSIHVSSKTMTSRSPFFSPQKSDPWRVPVFREYLLGLGVNSVSKASINGNLTRGPGASVMIVIGGPGRWGRWGRWVGGWRSHQKGGGRLRSLGKNPGFFGIWKIFSENWRWFCWNPAWWSDVDAMGLNLLKGHDEDGDFCHLN